MKTMQTRQRQAAEALCGVAIVLLLGLPGLGQERAGVSRTTLDSFTMQHCVACHGAAKQEGDVRLDGLMLTTESAEQWRRIAAVIQNEEMPPPSAAQPTTAQRGAAVKAIAAELSTLLTPQASVRRLSRYEYEKSVQDLLGIETPLAAMLPEEMLVDGFDNVASGLGISAVLLEQFLAAANAAFEATIRRVPPMEVTTRRAVMIETPSNQTMIQRARGGLIASQGAVVDFNAGWPAVQADEAHPLEAGIYRVRAAVWPHDPGSRTLTAAIFVGAKNRAGERRFVDLVDVTGTPTEPSIVTFTTYFEAGEAIHILPWIYPAHVTYRDKHERRPGVAIKWVETEGPLDQQFPSRTQQSLFGNSPSLAMEAGKGFFMRHRKGVKLHHVVSSAPEQDIQRIITDFAQRAFRRPVDHEMLQPLVELAQSRFRDGSTFEQAVQAGVCAVLCSPHFLLLNHDAPDDYWLASRLSYFLWSSIPDAMLLELASQGKLSDPKTLDAQVERMLNDPKAERLLEHFTDGWLDLRNIAFTTPDPTLYPEYDELLLHSMLGETRGFFRHMLEQDLSLHNLIDSDFSVLNQRMAEHYAIPGVIGHADFKVVPLPRDSIRGGLLTQASVLKVSANGTNTSPITRGVWVLDRLLGQAAAPPPPGVPAVEPDIRGATTMRQQLARHQEDAACNRCHNRIDPPGWALEEFDVIGNWRQIYRVTQGNPKMRIKNTKFYLGPAVDSVATLHTGERFRDFTEFRALLSRKSQMVTRAFASKLLVYACGRELTAEDLSSVDSVLDATRDSQHGLRSMVRAVVHSPAFRRP